MLTIQQKENLQLWYAALLGGNYIQGKHRLINTFWNHEQKQTQHSYCCLGVACEILKIEKDINGNLFVIDNLPYLAVMKAETFEAAFGLNAMVQHDLASLNDNGKTFEEIADYIRLIASSYGVVLYR